MPAWTMKQDPERIAFTLAEAEYRQRLVELAEILYGHLQGQLCLRDLPVSSESADSPYQKEISHDAA